MEKADFKSVRGNFKFGNNHVPIQNFYLQEAVKQGDDYVLKTVSTIVENDQDRFHDKCPMKLGGVIFAPTGGDKLVLGRSAEVRPQEYNAAMLYFIEQCLNGVQFGMLLFLLAAGLTLVFGIMDLVNLAHGSLYMLGAYFAATFAVLTGSFVARRHSGGRGSLLPGWCSNSSPSGRFTAATISTRCWEPLVCCCFSTSWCG